MSKWKQSFFSIIICSISYLLNHSIRFLFLSLFFNLTAWNNISQVLTYSTDISVYTQKHTSIYSSSIPSPPSIKNNMEQFKKNNQVQKKEQRSPLTRRKFSCFALKFSGGKRTFHVFFCFFFEFSVIFLLLFFSDEYLYYQNFNWNNLKPTIYVHISIYSSLISILPKQAALIFLTLILSKNITRMGSWKWNYQELAMCLI